MATQIAAGYASAMRRSGYKSVLRSSDVLFFDVVHAGESHRVQVKRVTSARRFTLRVRSATRDAVLTMPPRGSLARAKLFVESHAAWIGARVACLPIPMPFGAGAIIPLRGVMHEIIHRVRERGTVWTEVANDEPGALPNLCVSGEEAFISRRVQDYLIRQARADLECAVDRHASALDVKPRRMTLRDTATRWGSCSSSGALSFSWRLVMAPPHVLDYLAAHEIAHLKHMNHSDAFWSLIESLIPDYARAEGWLKAHGAGLMRFGAAAEPGAR